METNRTIMDTGGVVRFLHVKELKSGVQASRLGYKHSSYRSKRVFHAFLVLFDCRAREI